jgi:voltage-gated potassium channel
MDSVIRLYHILVNGISLLSIPFIYVKKSIEKGLQKVKRFLDRNITEATKVKWHSIIFKTETPEGKIFDTILIWIIVLSTLIVILETVTEFQRTFWWIFFILEWVFTVIFTIEYAARLYLAKKPLKYATSFYGVVDLLALIPTYVSVFFFGAQHLLVVRALRLLRVFRIFKMGHFVSEGGIVVNALKASRTKIYVFISFVILMAIVIGSVMYMVEGQTNAKFSNIPKGIYWAIVTMTTVGYGDITPTSPLGQFLATLVMIMGYGVIAVPTGIVTAEISSRVMRINKMKSTTCDQCGQSEHFFTATYCHNCGESLAE